MLGLTVFYDTGAGGQFLSGAIATALGDVVAPYTFEVKDKDRDGTDLKNRNRWFFNTKQKDFKEDKINVIVNDACHKPLEYITPEPFSRVVTVKIECNTLWELSMIYFNRHIKNNPDSDPTRYMTDFFDLKRPPQVDFDIQFEKDCERMAFNIVFPYRAFYDTDLQKQFCEGVENNVLKPIDRDMFSKLCRQFVIDNQQIYNQYLIKDF